MNWEQLAEKAYNTYMLGISNGAYPGIYASLYPETKLAWIEVVKSIYNLANEDARVMVVESICSGGL